MNEAYLEGMIQIIEEAVNKFTGSDDAKEDGRAAVKVFQKSKQEGHIYADASIQVLRFLKSPGVMR